MPDRDQMFCRYTARLAKGGGYFYFQSGGAAEWLDRTVNAETISSHTVE